MNKILIVMKKEIVTMLSRKGFLFALFGLPILASSLYFGIQKLNQNAPSAVSAIVGSFSDSSESVFEGYVDQSGLIQAIPPDFDTLHMREFSDEEAASQAVLAGEIEGYFLVEEDFLSTGDIYFVGEEVNPISEQGQIWLINSLLYYNLLDEDFFLMEHLFQTMNLEEEPLEAEVVFDDSNPLAFLVPYISMFIFYMVILTSASLLLNSVADEKQNRVIEVLLLSVSPRQLLVGKIVGLGLLGLVQTFTWIGTSYLIFNLGGQSFTIPENVNFDSSIFVWAAVFFVLGYGIYASLMAGLGALVPNIKEASQATILVIFPLIIPMMFNSVLIQHPNNLFSRILGIFPLTAPVAMITRIVAGSIPPWEIGLSILLQIVTIILIVNSVSKLFRAQILLGGQSFSAGRFFKALAGRV